MTDQSTTYPQQSKSGRPMVIAVAAFLLLIVIGVIALLPKLRHREDIATEAQNASGPPPVVATHVKAGSLATQLNLPGSVQAFEQTSIFARSNGYVKARYADIGDKVHAGQLLAVVEDPTTEQSLKQAQANLIQLKAQLILAQANQKLSNVNNDRWKDLYKQGVVSKLDADTHEAEAGTNDATVEAARANIAAGEAAVRNLQEQLGFNRITAPFAGVILSRSIDTGSLISSGSANSVTQLFTIGRADTVRVFSNIPQADAVGVHPGDTAKITFRELPGQTYAGKITRTSASVDPSTRTMLVEIDLKNDGKILPGMFADVLFNAPRSAPPVILGQNGLVMRTSGPQVYIIDNDNVAHLKNIVLGRDLGSAIEVVGGLKPGDAIILSPSDSVVDNGKVVPHFQD